MTPTDVIKVMQGIEAGKTIQHDINWAEPLTSYKWQDVNIDIDTLYIFGKSNHCYRVKPEPREFYINTYKCESRGFAHQSLEAAKSANSKTLGFIETIKVTEDINYE